MPERKVEETTKKKKILLCTLHGVIHEEETPSKDVKEEAVEDSQKES